MCFWRIPCSTATYLGIMDRSCDKLPGIFKKKWPGGLCKKGHCLKPLMHDSSRGCASKVSDTPSVFDLTYHLLYLTRQLLPTAISYTVPFLKNRPFHWTNRKVFGQRRPRSTLWVPSGPMDAPNDREAPGANPDTLHCGLARRRWAHVRSCMDTHHGAVHHEPARPPPWLPAARQVRLGPLGTDLPLVDLALVVSALAGARGAKKAKTGPKHDFLRSQVKKKALWWRLGAFWTPLGVF